MIVTETMAMDSLSFDISLVPGTKLCPRCWSEIYGILNNPKEYKDNKFLHTLRTIINFPENIHIPHLSDADQQDLDLELTQVCCYKQIVNC